MTTVAMIGTHSWTPMDRPGAERQNRRGAESPDRAKVTGSSPVRPTHLTREYLVAGQPPDSLPPNLSRNRRALPSLAHSAVTGQGGSTRTGGRLALPDSRSYRPQRDNEPGDNAAIYGPSKPLAMIVGLDGEKPSMDELDQIRPPCTPARIGGNSDVEPLSQCF